MTDFVTRKILGGVAGTAVLAMMMYFVAPMMLGQPMDIAAMPGSMMGNRWALGMAAQWMNGALTFPLLCAYLVYKLLPGSSTVRGVLLGGRFSGSPQLWRCR